MGSALLSDSRGFALLLRGHRGRARLTQEELAERAQLSVRTLRDLERGRTRYPHRDSVRRLAAALELTGEDRLTFEAAPPRPLGLPVIMRSFPSWELPAVSGNVPLDRVTLLRDVEDAVSVASGGGEPAVVTVTGPPGSGKTTLAVQCAHLLRARMAIETLVVDLGAEDRDPEELRSVVRLARVSRMALDSLTRSPGGGGCLLLLDDAQGAGHVLPLLSLGFTGVIVTSREPIARVPATRHITLTRRRPPGSDAVR